MAEVMRSVNGPIRTALEAQGGMLAIFSPADRSKIIKRGMREMGNLWLFKWMPLRFTKYAYMLGYRVSTKWKNRKLREGGVDMPYVGLTPPGGGPAVPGWNARNGEKMQVAAIRGGRVTASGTGGMEMVTIKVPYGHAIQTDKAAVFRTVAQNEIEDMAATLSRRIANEISGARIVTKNGMSVVRARTISRPKPRKVA